MPEEWDRNENSKVNMIVLLTLLSYLIGSIFISLINETAVQLVLIQCFCLAPGIAATVIFRKKNMSVGRAFADTYRIRKVKISTLLLVALMMLFLMPLLTLINLLSQFVTSYVASEEIVDRIADYPFIVSLLCVGIIPAVGEELTYRGFMYGHYRKRSILMGAALTGLIFGLMHGNLNQLAYAAVMGFVFAMVDEATGSTVSSMVMHALVNCSSVVIVYYGAEWMAKLTGSEGAEAVNETVEQAMNEAAELTPKNLLSYGVVAVIGTYIAYRLYGEIAYRNQTTVQIREDVRTPGRLRALLDMFTAPLVVTILVLIGLVVVMEMATRLGWNVS